MNKKIKIIDILNMIAKGELKDGTRFKVYSSCNDADSKPFICEYDKDYPGIIWCVTDDCKYNYKIDFMRILNYYVEILEDDTEDNTEEIEELAEWVTRRDGEVTQQEGKRLEMCYKIDELVREVRQQRKINDEIIMCLKRTQCFLTKNGFKEVGKYIDRAQYAVNKLRKDLNK